MAKCVRCGVDGRDVRLFDAIYEGRMETICERCSIIENVPVIKKPDSNQLKEAEKGFGVYERIKRLSKIEERKKNEVFFIEDKLNELNTKPELELPEKEKLNLVEHFHWHILKNRRRKGLTHKQLAEALGESEVVIQMLEKGKLPENAESLIRKFEQFFQIRLRKFSERERFMQEKEKMIMKEPVLLDSEGNELEMIPEEEFKEISEGVFEGENDEVLEENLITESTEKNINASDVDIKQINPKAVTIADLREIHKKKIEATRQEMIEEQRKIEERKRILEAEKEKRQRLIEERKRELQKMKEKESKELDKFLGGMELLKNGSNGENPEELI